MAEQNFRRNAKRFMLIQEHQGSKHQILMGVRGAGGGDTFKSVCLRSRSESDERAISLPRKSISSAQVKQTYNGSKSSLQRNGICAATNIGGIIK
ncbi:hypothetical protein CEXT_161831 [Caerostris extrusa]|uniref:Uncharacterized protein n=1 Tax=Caerostris extrusa TaxID=172846 RepID=A0AAV4VTQ4_CAEEX|nr:hypothetical protein CEXT_161831 [Caerostris extrusa]